MTDSTTQQRMRVSAGGKSRPYIMLPLDQLDAVKRILDKNQVSFWVDGTAISINGKPEVVVINLGRGADAEQIQKMLDTAN